MGSILFLVHVEEEFRYLFDPMYLQRIQRAKSCKKYDSVVFLNSRIGEGICAELKYPYSVTEWEWGWGYEPNCFNEDEKKWVIEANGHDYTWVPPEIREQQESLKRMKVYVGGGSYHECMRDWLDVLEHCGINYKVIDGYCYGK